MSGTAVEGALNNVQLNLVDDMDTLVAFKSWLGTTHEEDAIAFDTETEGLNPYAGEKVRLIQLGDTINGWAFPPEWHGAALEAMRKYEGPMVAHNSRFDVNFLRQNYSPSLYTPRWESVHDTMTLAHLDDPTRSRGLKPLSGMLIDPRAASSQSVLDKEMNLNNWDFRTVPIVKSGTGSSYWIYGALDPVLTCRLFAHFKDVRTTYARAYELEMGTVRAIANMERKGALVDLEYCHSMIGAINEYSRNMRQWIMDTHGIQNATSGPQCIKRFQEMGREITRFTKGGAPSLDKEMLQTFLIEPGAAGNDLAQALLDLRKAEKQVGPYFSNFEDLADSNGRVHPTIWPVGTRTARMSVQHPALQTLPREDPAVRDAFIPSPGNVLLSCDYDQVELRLATHFARDEGLRAAFAKGGDFFNNIASEAYNEPVVKGDPRRQLLKNGVYATLYGAGITKIAVTAGVPVNTMQAVMDRFHTNYPGIKRLQDEIETVARMRDATEGRPYVITPTGRRMPGDSGREYSLVNYLVQSHAAEVLKRAICDLDAAGYGEYMILPIHDELVFDVPKELANDMMVEIPRIMGDDSYMVPLTAGIDRMDVRWGDKLRKK